MAGVEGESGEERERQRSVRTIGGLKRRLFRLPGLRDVLKPPGAVDLLHVSHADLRRTHGHEMRPRPTDGVLGQIGQGLADRRSEQEGAPHLVERRHVLVEVRVGVELLAVDQISLPGKDLQIQDTGRFGTFLQLGKEKKKKKSSFGVKLTMTTVEQVVTAASMPRVMVSALMGYLMLSSSQ